MTDITITLLGTNGWYSSVTGNTTCISIDTPDYFIILDAGDGLSKIPDYYPEITKPAYLFLSHLHLDHISGLHTISRCRFLQGLSIFGPPGIGILKEFIGYPYTIPLVDLSFPVTIHEVSEGRLPLPFPVLASFLVHSQPVYGYRLELGRTVAFCTDTGPCQGILDLGKDADLLFTECSNLPGEGNPAWPHLNPETAVACAEEAGAKHLVLIHFAANHYNSKEIRENIRNTVTTDIDLTIGQDGLIIRL